MDSKPPEKPDAERVRQAYEPPRLRYLGSVRELTLKSGARTDAPPVHPRRP